MTTPTTAGGAVLPVVGYRLNSGHGNRLRETLDDATKAFLWAGKPAWRELTYRDAAQAEIDALRAELAALKAAQDDQARDARRYRKLRRQDWFASPLAVVVNPKDCVKPGSDCPSWDRLDAMIDAIEETPMSTEDKKARAFEAWRKSVEWWDFNHDGRATNRKSSVHMAWEAWQEATRLALMSNAAPEVDRT